MVFSAVKFQRIQNVSSVIHGEYIIPAVYYFLYVATLPEVPESMLNSSITWYEPIEKKSNSSMILTVPN